jgi:hypothetical protein
MTVSDTTIEFIRDAYERAIETLLDDTDEVTDNYRELASYHKQLLTVGEEIGTPFWEVANKSEFTRRNILEYKSILRIYDIPEE